MKEAIERMRKILNEDDPPAFEKAFDHIADELESLRVKIKQAMAMDKDRDTEQWKMLNKLLPLIADIVHLSQG